MFVSRLRVGVVTFSFTLATLVIKETRHSASRQGRVDLLEVFVFIVGVWLRVVPSGVSSAAIVFRVSEVFVLITGALLDTYEVFVLFFAASLIRIRCCTLV